MLVLLVENDASAAALLIERLQEDGHEVQTADDLLTATPLITQATFDAALLATDGPSKPLSLFSYALRKQSEFCRLLLLSNLDPAPPRSAFEGVDPDAVLSRPYRYADLLAHLQEEGAPGSSPIAPGRGRGGRIDPAHLTTLSGHLTVNADDHHARLLLAFCLLQNGDYRGSLDHLEVALRDHYESALAHFYAGTCWFQLAEYQEAGDSWTRAATLAAEGPLHDGAQEALAHLESLYVPSKVGDSLVSGVD